jgi:hypothetical protein
MDPLQSFIYEDTIYSVCETRNKENQWQHTTIAARKIQDRLKKFRSIISDSGQEARTSDEVQAAVRAFGGPANASMQIDLFLLYSFFFFFFRFEVSSFRLLTSRPRPTR